MQTDLVQPGCVVWMRRLTFALWVAASLIVAPAQPIITAPSPSTGQPDPLSAFMITQPPIDTTTPVEVTVAIEPGMIALGQSAVYRIVLNVLEQSVESPQSIPVPDNCGIRQGASGQFLQNLGTAIVPQTTLLYHLQPKNTGTLVIGGFTIRVRGEDVEVPPARLTVLPEGSAASELPPRIELTSKRTDYFVGETIDLEATLRGRTDGSVRSLTQVDVTGLNLIVDRTFRTQRKKVIVVNGVPTPTFCIETSATPMRPGRTEVIAQGFLIGNPVRTQMEGPGQVSISVVRPTYTLIDSEPLELNILPLPVDSRLPGFTGAIGLYSIDRPTLSTNRTQAGGLLTLSVTLRGGGNLERVLPPTIESHPEWQVFQAVKDTTPAPIIRQRGFVTFDYKLIPLDDSIQSTPAIPFCYFDPESRQYVDLSIPSIPVQVDPSPNLQIPAGGPSLIEGRSILQNLITQSEEPTALAPGLQSPGRTAKSLRPLHQQVWFVGMQLIPAGLLGGLWFWDRRRRHLEAHPELVIRRRARKAIRRHSRQARRAARRLDAREFLWHSIQGFREAGAPAVAANPRALICSEVINSIPAQLRSEQTTTTVTQLFSAANDWRFGDRSPDEHQLLGLARQVDSQLKTLRDGL